jgi:hypothetical protein
MSLEIDHLLQIVSSEDEAYRIAKATGLKIRSKTVHVGQGTSGIFFAFAECYFEFIWMRDEEEARTNLLRFDKKFNAVRDGGSPFGVSLRGNVSDPDLNTFTAYNPAYGKYTIYFTKESLTQPHLPLLFFHTHPDRPNNVDWHPINSKTIDRNTCNFDSEIKRFNSVEIHGPHANLESFPQISFVKSDTHKMIINVGGTFKFSEIVSLK